MEGYKGSGRGKEPEQQEYEPEEEARLPVFVYKSFFQLNYLCVLFQRIVLAWRSPLFYLQIQNVKYENHDKHQWSVNYGNLCCHSNHYQNVASLFSMKCYSLEVFLMQDSHSVIFMRTNPTRKNETGSLLQCWTVIQEISSFLFTHYWKLSCMETRQANNQVLWGFWCLHHSCIHHYSLSPSI